MESQPQIGRQPPGAVHAGEAFLLVAVFLPGILTAAACIARFGRPIWQGLRD